MGSRRKAGKGKSPLIYDVDMRLVRRLRAFYRDWCGGSGRADDLPTHEFVFHMTDWIEDFHRLRDAFENPVAMKPDQFNDAIYGFLIHASGHIWAAAEMADIEPCRFDVTPKRRFLKRRRAAKKA